MTWDTQETVELLQGPILRDTTRIMEEEHQGKIAIFEKMIQHIAWQVIGAQEGAFRGTKTLLFSKLQMEEAKEISWEDLEASKPNGEEDLNITGHGKGGGKSTYLQW
ncbi:hypothetical protein M9H77_29711 [Catharanthus roseus]|uniref:Uncharacterized protein n=1 Tax=Catharanthus roseus TaxID=4058 RepID=A0ACB9ZVK8_CATRO|nr:hypothetical protein M9H77_29711 [Catharanthus roseus]